MNDADAFDAFTFSHVHQPSNGTASAVTSHTALQYVPDASFTSGTDAFHYRATDSTGNFVGGTARVRVYDSTALDRCTRIGTVDSSGVIGVRTFSNDCTFYSQRTTRLTPGGSLVTMDYFVNWPSNTNTLKAVVVLIGGGDLNMNFSGSPQTGVPGGTGGGNFLVRTAQLFAEAGYMTIAINKPSDQPPAGSTDTHSDADLYRISVNHAVDILKVLKRFNTQDLPVFVAGTSAGAVSAVATNLIATGILLSSPMTSSGLYMYVGDPAVPSLQPSFVQRPVHVLWNTDDQCSASTPSGSQALYTSLAGTTSASFDTVSGGVQVTQPGNGLTSDSIGPCEAFDFHGFFGIEPTAVAKITGLTGVTYALSHTTTSLGGTVSLSGSTVTYTPPSGASNTTDYYVYVVTDSSGGVGAGVITVKIGP